MVALLAFGRTVIASLPVEANVSAKTRNIRPSVVAGLFYPEQASELKLQVEDMLARACDAEIEGEIHGLIAPHAGYSFSDRTAAAAYRQVRGKPYDTAGFAAASERSKRGARSA